MLRNNWLVILIFTASMSIGQSNFLDVVLPILKTNCFICHNSNGHGPIDLTNYQALRSNAQMIKYVVSTQLMPPFNHTSDYKTIEHNLTDIERKQIIAWVDNGFNTESFEYTRTPQKHKQKPEITFSLPSPFIIPDKHDHFSQVFVFDIQNDQNLNISYLRFSIANPKIVRRVEIHIDTSKNGKIFDNYDQKPGFNYGVGLPFKPSMAYWEDWHCGQDTLITYRNKQIKLIPSKSKILIKVYYQSLFFGREDKTKITLGYTIAKNKNSIHTIPIIDTSLLTKSFKILPNTNPNFQTEFKVERKMTLFSLLPIAKSACVNWEVILTKKDGIQKMLLKIPLWKEDWTRKYHFSTPILLQIGDVIIIKATYDNTKSNNLLEIKPPIKLTYGNSNRGELFEVYADVVEE
jgi:hypothetical protein